MIAKEMHALFGWAFFVLSLFLLLPRISTADPLDHWHWRNPVSEGWNTLNGVTWGNGTFVAVGGFGTILTSPDGTTWTSRTSGTSNSLNGVTWGNSTFVVVGEAGTILQSDPVISGNADLSLTKTGSPNPVTVGSSLTYSVTVINHGPDAATGVVMTDTLPASVTLISATSGQGSGSGTGTVTCTLGSLAKSAIATVTIIVTPKAAGTIGNTVNVTENEADPDMTNNTASITTTANAQQFTLNVTKTGTGSGPVTSSPAGIDCGTDCSEGYAGGTPVTLTAAPVDGSTFAGWSGGGCSGTGSCTVTLNAAKSVTAPFTKTIISPLTLGASVLEGEVGVVYSGSLRISGGLPPYTIRIIKGVLPSGLSLGPEGILGTPAKVGNTSLTVQVTDTLGSSVSKKINLKILKAVSIATKTLGKGKVGKKYNTTLKATGGKKPYAWLLVSGDLPEGLNLDSSTGKITGIPLSSGSFNLTFQVTDPLEGVISKDFTLIVDR